MEYAQLLQIVIHHIIFVKQFLNYQEEWANQINHQSNIKQPKIIR